MLYFISYDMVVNTGFSILINVAIKFQHSKLQGLWLIFHKYEICFNNLFAFYHQNKFQCIFIFQYNHNETGLYRFMHMLCPNELFC